MGRRLILDTNILIAYERGSIDRTTLDEDELTVASVSIAEYRVGIELADTPERAAERARAGRSLLATRLRQQGVTVVDAPPDRLPPALADAYLDLKAAGQL